MAASDHRNCQKMKDSVENGGPPGSEADPQPEPEAEPAVEAEPDQEAGAEGVTMEDFVTRHFQEQLSKEDPEVDQDRRSDFFSRALAESKRMNKEVEKSYQRMDQLHMELGAETFTSWRTEHSQQVLSPEMAQRVEQVHPKSTGS